MTFPGYTFAVERLQKQTNDKLDSLNAKLAQLIQILTEVKTKQAGNHTALMNKLEEILEELQSPGGTVDSMVEEEDGD